MDDEQVKMVVVSGKCTWCKGKVFGMAETRTEALKRLEFNLNKHQQECFDKLARGKREQTTLYG